MANRTSERVAVGDRLSCGHCGTEIRMEQVGTGHVQCCERPLRPSVGNVPAGAGAAHARCEDCGNEACIEHDGGGSLSCCHAQMIRD